MVTEGKGVERGVKGDLRMSLYGDYLFELQKNTSKFLPLHLELSSVAHA